MMKKVVANLYDESGAYDTLESSAYNAGYDMTVTDNGDIELVAESNAEYMPTISVKTNKDDRGIVTYESTIEFPTLYTSSFSYSDDFEYWVNKWMRVARFITDLNEFAHDPSSM